MVPTMTKYTPTIQRLLHDIDSFLAAHPTLSATVFGQRAVNDGHLVRDLRRGLGIGAVVSRLELRKITSVADCTPVAVVVWEAANVYRG